MSGRVSVVQGDIQWTLQVDCRGHSHSYYLCYFSLLISDHRMGIIEVAQISDQLITDPADNADIYNGNVVSPHPPTDMSVTWLPNDWVLLNHHCRRCENQIKGWHQLQCDLEPGLPPPGRLQARGAGPQGPAHQDPDPAAGRRRVHHRGPDVSHNQFNSVRIREWNFFPPKFSKSLWSAIGYRSAETDIQLLRYSTRSKWSMMR